MRDKILIYMAKQRLPPFLLFGLGDRIKIVLGFCFCYRRDYDVYVSDYGIVHNPNFGIIIVNLIEVFMFLVYDVHFGNVFFFIIVYIICEFT